MAIEVSRRFIWNLSFLVLALLVVASNMAQAAEAEFDEQNVVRSMNPNSSRKKKCIALLFISSSNLWPVVLQSMFVLFPASIWTLTISRFSFLSC